MALFMDLHSGLHGITKEECELNHIQDLRVQEKYGVKYLKFWLNEAAGKVFCLIEAPSKEACRAVHAEAHGNIASEIIEVDYSDFNLCMGSSPANEIGQVIDKDGTWDSAVRTFLFTDIVNSTKITQEIGDGGSFMILKRHNEIVRNALQEYGGKEVKHTGDGIMACFLSATRAVGCAQAIQLSLERFREKYTNIPLYVRIGLNAGEPVTEGEDFFGVAVQTAKRICDYCKPNEILASNVIHDLCLGREIQFSEIGKVSLKGLDQPSRLYKVNRS